MNRITRIIGLSLVTIYLSATLFSLPSTAADTNPAPQTPPLERYTCYQVHAASLTYTYMGYFILQAGNKYVWGVGKAKPNKAGRYDYASTGIHFADGPLNGVKGQFETKKDGRHLLELKIQGEKQYASDDGISTWYCNCDAHDPDNGKIKQ